MFELVGFHPLVSALWGVKVRWVEVGWGVGVNVGGYVGVLAIVDGGASEMDEGGERCDGVYVVGFGALVLFVGVFGVFCVVGVVGPGVWCGF